MATIENTYTGNGSTTNYTFTFEYLEQADVKVTLDSVATSAFTFANATTISFNTAPGAGVAIRIYRDTDVDILKATFFPGSAIKAEDLNNNFTQNNFSAQESKAASAQAPTALSNSVTAISTANQASADAAAALAAVSAAVAYTPVADVTSIPVSPADGDYIEVLDGTGIESFTPLAGLPVGFVGDSGLSIRLNYTSAGSTWNWVDYIANDADTRYIKSTDIGVTVQAYDVDTAKYDDTTANFTGTLQNGGSNVVVDSDIGATVQAYDANALSSSDIGVSVQAYDADTAKLDVAQTFTADQTFTASQTYPRIPINSQTAAYTLVASDAGKHINITTGGVTVPSGVFSIGDAVSIYNNSSSNQTITEDSGVTLRKTGTANTGNRTLAQYGVATLLCVASDEFVISGGGLS